jgi:signal transduction histidine kinase
VVEPGSSWLTSLRFLETGADGATVVRAAGREDIRCTVAPPLADVLAAATASGEPHPAVLTDTSGLAVELLVWPVPGRPGTAIAVAADLATQLLAPAVENLVNQIAHDVRNFAFNIGLQAELGTRKSTAAPELGGIFATVLRHVDALRQYLDKMLLYGRSHRLAPVPLDAGTFVREQAQRFIATRDASQPPIDLWIDVPEAPCPVRWDAKLLAAALRELLDNAARSASPPPPVRVTLAPDGPQVVIEVRDDGTGIPPETMSRLVVPMAVRRAGGAGLGVAIARKIAALHGGELHLDSSPQGTTARLTLPKEPTSE